jgi:pimeloyl-ACP methyl ester carboxylesterase
MAEFTYEGFRISYDEYGAGDRPFVLVHGLLMNRRMFEPLATELAGRGNRVIAIDLLGHGRSDRPEDLTRYSMPLFAYQVEALINHLELESAVVGGTSLGANVALETAFRFPDRVSGLFIEMPVLDNALAAVAAIFTPIILGLRFGRPIIEVVSRVTSILPRTNYMIDIALDWVRQEPGPSVSVLEGLMFGETAPRSAERKQLDQPALIVGHSGDPLHPFSDSGMLAEEMPNARLVDANTILEWRISPGRLNDELAFFLDDVWAQAEAQERTQRKARMAGQES